MLWMMAGSGPRANMRRREVQALRPPLPTPARNGYRAESSKAGNNEISSRSDREAWAAEEPAPQSPEPLD